MKPIEMMLCAAVIFYAGMTAVFSQEMTVLRWDDCEAAAMMNNENLRAARSFIEEKDANKGVSRAVMLPSISASGSAGKQSGASVSENQNYWNYSLNAKQLVFSGFNALNDYKSSCTQYDAALLAYKEKSSEVRLRVREAYIALLRAQEMEKILKEITQRRQHNAELVMMKYKSGSEHKGSYLSAKADSSKAQADYDAALREKAIAAETLCRLTGIKNKNIIIEDHLAADSLQPEPRADCIASHPAVLKYEREIAAAELSVKSSQSGYSPSLYALAGAGKSGQSASDAKTQWSAGFELTAPLFSGGETWYGVKKSEAQLNQIKNTRDAAVKELELSLLQAWTDLQDGIRTAAVQKEYLEAASERGKIAEAQYSIGTLSFDNWTVIEDALAMSKKNYVEACITVMKKEASVRYAKGEGFENEEKN